MVWIAAPTSVPVPRHYPALKTLEHLEQTFLPQVSHYRFCQAMVATIPRLREDIRERSMADLKDFLESIRKHSERIGETAVRQVGLGWGLGISGLGRGWMFLCSEEFRFSKLKQ